jgi:hypothetical protein
MYCRIVHYKNQVREWPRLHMFKQPLNKNKEVSSRNRMVKDFSMQDAIEGECSDAPRTVLAV